MSLNKKAKKYTLWLIAMVTTSAFAYLHGGIAEFAFAYGLLLTIVAMVTKALYLPIIIHFLSNLITLILPHGWLFELNRIFIPVGAYESSLIVHYVMFTIVTLGYAALILSFKDKLLEMSGVLASKFTNHKPDNSGASAS